MANGMRKPAHIKLSEKQIDSIKKDAESIGIPIEVLSFNTGHRTSCSEDNRIIFICGDILPDIENGTSARDRMSYRAVLAHEYYGHYLNIPSQFDAGDWRDEFRASYSAAINAPDRRKFIDDHVSGYAAGRDENGKYTKDQKETEFFAELFAEYVMSPNPRQAAQIFGDIINNALGH